MAQKSTPHDGHRQRMLKKFLDHGIGVFEPHEALEILLFSLLPRINTNEIAHELINKFGSLKDIFHATISDLKSVNRIGQNTAIMLNFIGEFFGYLNRQNHESITFDSSSSIIKYCINYYRNKDYECSSYFLLDDKMSLLYKGDFDLKKPNETELDYNKIIRNVVKYDCSSVFLSHNHPVGNVFASSDDIKSTRVLANHLSVLNVRIMDHIIVQNDSAYSMRNSGVNTEIWY